MTIVRGLLTAMTAVALAVVSPAGGRAQKLSDHPITIIVPFTPGTGPDILARILGEELQRRWNQSVVVENKPGATGNIGAQIVARAEPDGHKLLMTSNPFTANVSLFKNLPYDPATSFAPIIDVGVASLALAVHPSIPVKSIRELVAYLKERPGQINYSSPGIGGPHHLAMELFKLQTKVEVMHIPYKGSAGALQDLVAGHVGLGFVPPHTSADLAQRGQLRLLAVASKERIRVQPDLPTLSEQGVPGFEVELWYGLLAPAGTPADIITRYNSVLNDILRQSDIAAKLDKQGLLPRGGSPEAFASFLASDMKKWRHVVEVAKIKAQ